MRPPADEPPDGTSSAVPADLRAYSRAAVQIDEQIHQLALRLGRVLDAYRATKPEFGRPIPRIEDDLERYARRCLEIDRRVGLIADAFENAGSALHGGSGAATSSQPVVAAEATIAAALDHAHRAGAAPPPRKTKEHHDHGLLGGLIHAVEHPGDTLSHAASAVEHTASDALRRVEHAAEHRLHDIEDAGAALVHGIEHPTEMLDAAAAGLEKASGEAADFGGQVVSGAASAGGEALHAIEHPAETLSAAESLARHAAKHLVGGAEHVIGDVVGGAEHPGGEVLRAIEHPGDTAAALAEDSEHMAGAALHGLESIGGGILHAIERPWDTLPSAEQAVEDFVTGFATGARDMAQAAMLLARVIPGTPMWMASMAIDPEGTAKLQQQFAQGLMRMVEDPGEALGNMIDIEDLKAGHLAKWEGHITPDVIVTLLTMGAGGAAAGAGGGLAQASTEELAETAVMQEVKSAAEHAAEAEGAPAVLGRQSVEEVEATDAERWERLGRDPATGGYRRSEMETATRVEHEFGVRLERATDPHVDWVDANGKTYDAVGNFDGKHFDAQWPNLQERILDHLEKADYVPIDVSGFSVVQVQMIEHFIGDLGPRVFLVGK